ncbi:LINE-1 type transposase domain-containing protein 1 [Xyrichtys novacula]|uniref:LINE-1 type transposase domain-containing protein 1 n=1 Tax=Xyrichtys novacula TaxID=13765 RepID=A0AAV1H196_XYRNO|nr:LINE-1 type transposase domain-containing protein 1 [Xyrichtys novacula]
MNLRSGAATKVNIAKKKTKKKDATNISNKEMATGSLEATIQTMMQELKGEIKGLKEDLIKQIGSLRTDVESFATEIKQVQKDVKEVRAEMGNAVDKIAEAEERINQLEEGEVTINNALKHLLREHKKINQSLEYQEQKSRQFNARIFQVIEGIEQQDMVGFVKSILVEQLKIPADTFHICAAHRSLAKKPTGEDAAPRSIVVRFLSWNTREKVVKTAWAKKDITAGGKRIYFDRDLPEKVQKERRRYAPLRLQLKEKKIKSFIIHPAKLKVFEEEGSFIIYNTPEDAETQLRAKGLISTEPCVGAHRGKHGTLRKEGAQSAPFQRSGGDEETLETLLEDAMRGL